MNIFIFYFGSIFRLSFRVFFVCLVFVFDFISPEFSYRPGLSVLSEDSNNAVPSHGAGGPPNRPLPPTPDDDDQAGDRTLIMKRVSMVDTHNFKQMYLCSNDSVCHVLCQNYLIWYYILMCFFFLEVRWTVHT